MTDNTTANVWGDILRVIYRLLDTVVYWLLGLMYQIFFNVASAELFTNETVKNFYGRVQLIIGVFMIFKLAVSIVKGIVNPDTFTDKKSGGASIITRVIFALVMLTIIVPINIPNASSEYEIQLNNNGLLFGTLYSLQHRILANNTLGKLILGTTDGQTNTIDNAISSNDNEQLKKSANLFTSTILKGFIRINLKEGKEDETKKENWMCENDLSNDALNEYKKLDADPETIIEMTTLKCDAPDAGVIASIINSDQRYMFAYKGLISAIVGGVFVYILLNFTIDIAVRAIKLAILRLIAPIPIISYIDPGTGAKTFESWTKNLTSTYIDLFLRLAIIYFVIFLIQDIIVNGIVVNTATGVVGFLTYIFIFLGLFIFAKQAPKFIKQIFGMKDDGGKLFGGLGEAIGAVGSAAAVGAAFVGGAGSFAAGMRASRLSDETRANYDPNVNPNSLLNRGKHLLSGIAGGVSGLSTGMKAATTAKEHALRNTLDAIQQRNARSLSVGDTGSTLLGRGRAHGQRLFFGETAADRAENELKTFESRRKSADAVKSFADKKAATTNWTNGTSTYNGVTVTGNYQAWTHAKNAAQSEGRGSFMFNGQSYTMEQANNLDYGLMTSNSSDYIAQNGRGDDEFASLIADFEEKNPGRSHATRGEVKDIVDENFREATRLTQSAAYRNIKADSDATRGGGKK